MIRQVIASIVIALMLTKPVCAVTETTWWQFQSVDTMKYSRDLARQKSEDVSFDAVIDQQVQSIAQIGANYVAIATPYDEEFVPFLQRWVGAARKYGLNVWFRGNWSGWEGWFNYSGISRGEHIFKTTNFIKDHPDLFQSGDIFSSCPECENGGPGDPRQNGDIAGHRQFLIDEYQAARESFRKIGRNVSATFNPMNGDVAKLIMNKQTTQSLGGIVVVDHYVSTPEQLAADIREIGAKSSGKIVLGEFGAPIPGINQSMDEKEQAEWIRSALNLLVKESSLIGINYWVGFGGSTEIWKGDGSPKPAVNVIASFFHPRAYEGIVVNEFGQALAGIPVNTQFKKVSTDNNGKFLVPYLYNTENVSIITTKYINVQLSVDQANQQIILVPQKRDIFYRLSLFLYGLFKRK